MKPFYQDNSGIVLYHGRCEDVLPTLPERSIDAVICDVPYGTTACAWDTPIAFDFMWRELKRVTKRNAAIVLFGSQPFTSALVMSNPTWFRYEIIWQKTRASGHLDANEKPLKAHENICVFYQAQPTYNPQKMPGLPYSVRGKRAGHEVYGPAVHTAVNTDYDGWRYPISVLQYSNGANSAGRQHSSQKPLALLSDLILTYTNEGDTVLDFTSGSGTTPVAAKKLGRKCIAIEQELEYCEVTVPRLYQNAMQFQETP